MLQEQYIQKESEIWRNLIESEIAYIQARQEFVNSCRNKAALIQTSLHNPVERGTALRLLKYLQLEEIQSLFDDLLDLVSVSHSDIELCRQAIKKIPKAWLLGNIENRAEVLLQNGTDEEYRRLLELYVQIDSELAQRLAIRALQHKDPDIREVGEDFTNYLKNE